MQLECYTQCSWLPVHALLTDEIVSRFPTAPRNSIVFLPLQGDADPAAVIRQCLGVEASAATFATAASSALGEAMQRFVSVQLAAKTLDFFLLGDGHVYYHVPIERNATTSALLGFRVDVAVGYGKTLVVSLVPSVRRFQWATIAVSPDTADRMCSGAVIDFEHGVLLGVAGSSSHLRLAESEIDPRVVLLPSLEEAYMRTASVRYPALDFNHHRVLPGATSTCESLGVSHMQRLRERLNPSIANSGLLTGAPSHWCTITLPGLQRDEESFLSADELALRFLQPSSLLWRCTDVVVGTANIPPDLRMQANQVLQLAASKLTDGCIRVDGVSDTAILPRAQCCANVATADDGAAFVSAATISNSDGTTLLWEPSDDRDKVGQKRNRRQEEHAARPAVRGRRKA